MNVGVMRFVIARDGVDDRAGLLRCGVSLIAICALAAGPAVGLVSAVALGPGRVPAGELAVTARAAAALAERRGGRVPGGRARRGSGGGGWVGVVWLVRPLGR